MSIQSRLADRVTVARRSRFVGRSSELALFQSALSAEELPFCLLFMHGPGGTGKTSLLREFDYICHEKQIPCTYLDAGNLDPSPDGFVAALGAASAPTGAFTVQGSSHQPLSQPSRQVLLVDSFESLEPLDGWLRGSFLPQLPQDTLIVLASIDPPSADWRADPDWQSLIKIVPLRNLAPDESRSYLTRRGVPEEQQGLVMDFTHGHPLALSLVADLFDQQAGIRFQPEAEPEIVRTLLRQLLRKVPDGVHRAAVEATATVRVTTEPLLAAVLGIPDALDLFEWLRGLSFIESSPHGIYPHDLAREALAAELRWRNPDCYAEFRRRARDYYRDRLTHVSGHDQQRVLFDYIYLDVDNPAVRSFLQWQEGAGSAPDSPREDDGPALREMVAQHEGEESARILERWLQRQPGGFLVFRDATGQPAGFLAAVALHEAERDDILADPAAQAAWEWLQAHVPLRPGEGATLFRFWMARDSYQRVSALQNLILINMVRHLLNTPGLAFTFLPCADPEQLAPLLDYADQRRLPEADFLLGNRRYSMRGHDWRVVPLAAWLEQLDSEGGGSFSSPASPRAAGLAVVLSRPDFESAVRHALRDFSQPESLRGSPLLRSRMIGNRVPAGSSVTARVTALQELIQEASRSLGDSPRLSKYHDAVHHTYLHPAPSQERAAELLGVPFSTFRRHLKAGVAMVTDHLWQLEIGAEDR